MLHSEITSLCIVVPENVVNALSGLPGCDGCVAGDPATLAADDTDPGDVEDPIIRGDVDEDEDSTDKREVGANKRKLQSRPFLLQFVQDGCLISHYVLVSKGP